MFSKIIMRYLKASTALRIFILLFGAMSFSANAQQLLSENDALYPRVVKLSHSANPEDNGAIIVSVTSFAGGVGHADIFISHDDGESFELLNQINDEDFQGGLCCGGLYELPASVNALPAGTLLWAGSVGQENPAEPMQMKIYNSLDQGETWSYLSNCLTASEPKSNGGLWEAEFTIAATGELVCFYSDETLHNHSQVLRYTKSSDGINWSEPVDVVASNDERDRPGMAVVVRLPNGEYAMSYEICGPLHCATYIRTSLDGLDWGDPAHLGEPVMSEYGLTFWATPTMALSPRPEADGHQLILQGLRLISDGREHPGSGGTLFISHSGDPAGPWEAYDTPTPIDLPPGTGSNYCQNYSSPLLPLDGGRRVLQLASDFSADNICRTQFNVGALGGVRASVEDLNVGQDGGAEAEVRISVSPGYSGDYSLAVSIPELEMTASLSQSQVTVLSDSDAVLTLSLASQSVASLPSGPAPILAGFLFFPWVLWSVLVRRKKRAALLFFALVAPLIFIGCGGGGGSSDAGSPSKASTRYTGIFTATSVDNPDIKTSTQFTVTVVETQ
jgi:hypothetical protein